jgi:DNA recombination protein RmuC
MFLATEGLFAEALREPGFHDRIRSVYQVVLTGPTTLAALLNSLSVGFQTLAIEERSSEIRAVLGAVRTEFGHFTQGLERVKKQLGAASNSIEHTFRRTRAMERTLRGVEAVPVAGHTRILTVDEDADGFPTADEADRWREEGDEA